MNRDDNPQPGPRYAEIETAARELRETIALETGRLADRLLGRPEFGSAQWQLEWDQRGTPEGRRRQVDWYLVKIRIDAAAGLDPHGNAVNARGFGASWAEIGDAYGISAEGAAERWERAATDFIERYRGTALLPECETPPTPTQVEPGKERPNIGIERSR
ncbi:hypothetical protein F5X71_08390 [Nocardia brasiliensis]|uniref:Uncharacterized protein n=1 Tax=Nocardia brasiliensis TaxID=37326 RepID=A0A6G9XN61_NOCBR|nr:hypothetical protein [Nocardia brasiliensis]QIS02339.1 hypothetical protein F5X71_08390 [Nocardia brasiliensis]